MNQRPADQRAFSLEAPMSLTFVNHNGDPITDSRMAAMRAQGMELERQRRLAAKADAVSVHKGWRVSGIAPGLLDEAKQAHERLCQMAQRPEANRRSPLMKLHGCALPSAPQCAPNHTSFKRQRSNAKSWPSRRAGWRFRSRRSKRWWPDQVLSNSQHRQGTVFENSDLIFRAFVLDYACIW